MIGSSRHAHACVRSSVTLNGRLLLRGCRCIAALLVLLAAKENISNAALATLISFMALSARNKVLVVLTCCQFFQLLAGMLHLLELVLLHCQSLGVAWGLPGSRNIHVNTL